MSAARGRGLALAASLALLPVGVNAQAGVTVHAAGSLRDALTEVAREFEAQPPRVSVRLVFGASGLLKDRLLAGETSDVFASANMEHPQALADAGRAEAPVTVFARNALCALAGPGFALEGRTLVERLLEADVKVGTSTPRADPSGDYAFEMFDRIEAVGAGPSGSAARLKAKALQLTGGPQSPAPPAGRSVYGMLLAERRADVFITYCTNAASARREQPALRVLPVPDAVNVSARYGMALLKPAGAEARSFAMFLTGARGREVLASHGFLPP